MWEKFPSGFELIKVYCGKKKIKKSIAVQAVCRQDVNEIVGTSWTLASKRTSNILRLWKKVKNICIFQIPFSQCSWPQLKKLFWGFFSAWGNLLVCWIWSLTDTRNRFFANNCLILDKYVMGIFFLQILSSFSSVRTGKIRFGQNWTKTRHVLSKTFEIPNFHFFNGIAA